MPQDRTVNPATAQLKADKARALKKSKAAVSAQRNERLAQRNPSRLERQISDLKTASNGGDLNARDKKQLVDLERQLTAVRKAREKVGDKAPTFGGGDRGARGRGRGGVLGKRSRGRDSHAGSRRDETSGSETDESVRNIPMPRDTPPPIPASHRRGPRDSTASMHENGNGSGKGNANMTPLGEGRERHPHALPQKPEPVAVAKTMYEAKPVVRDLRKEAVKAFMPAVVARKVQAVKGEGMAGGRLLEEEEVEKLEREGYGTGPSRNGDGVGGKGREMVVDATPKVVETGKGKERQERSRQLEEEEERFSREVRMEDISDDDL
ncbi:MAG: hypothetical protein Q9216_001840 [Gyalolechia sp. 2 TL-2023]